MNQNVRPIAVDFAGRNGRRDDFVGSHLFDRIHAAHRAIGSRVAAAWTHGASHQVRFAVQRSAAGVVPLVFEGCGVGRREESRIH